MVGQPLVPNTPPVLCPECKDSAYKMGCPKCEDALKAVYPHYPSNVVVKQNVIFPGEASDG